jgi:methylated-DNA-[protein]-cysteine S-methyltransferase
MHYGQLAEALGRPGAARAVGAANGANPVVSWCPAIGSSGVTAPDRLCRGVQRKSGYCAMKGIFYFD